MQVLDTPPKATW